MIVSSEENDRHPVELLAEEFAEKIRAGQQPSIDDYVNRFPEHEDLIRAILPSVSVVENAVRKNDLVRQSDSQMSNVLLSMNVRTPDRLGDFKIVREIGRGGMGIVFEAIQQSLNRHVALKVISGLISNDDRHKSRFRREAEAAASLHHTNIVPIYGTGEDQGLQYYAMQLIDAVTLNDVVECLRSESHIVSNEDLVTERSSDLTYNTSFQKSNSSGAFDRVQAVRQLLRYANESIPNESAWYQPINKSNVTIADANSRMTKASSRPSELISLDEPIDARLSDKETESINLDKPHVSAEEYDFNATKQAKTKLNRAYFRNVARIIANAANALDYAHHQRILHRDIKPANLLLDREGTVWITDFGLARRTDLDGATQAGEILGTLRYMAPEQVRGHGDHRVDIYSLGLTLYELLTLKPAIETPKARLIDPLNSFPIASPRSIQPTVPIDLQTIAMKACSFDPASRYQQARDLEEDLNRFLEDRPIKARKASKSELLVRWARRNPLIATLSGATAALLMALVVLLAIWNGQQVAAIDRIKEEYERAETNLGQKTAALIQVDKERQRAEKNLELALKAFDNITINIASRGNMLGSGSGLDDEELVTLADTSLNKADITLLESLLEFFDRFSEENSKDLRLEAAVARYRVGDIQHKLGQLQQAEVSYQKAWEVYRSLHQQKPDEKEPLLQLLAIHNELLVVYAKQGMIGKAANTYRDARQLIETSMNLVSDREVRFALAKLLNSFGTVGSKYVRGNRPRPLAARLWGGSETILPQVELLRVKREAEFNSESLSILRELVKEQPDTTAYTITLARVLKDEVRIARLMNDIPRADDALKQATQIFESLCDSHADSSAFRYELADTLNASIATRPIDRERCEKALEICDQICKENPHVAEYKALKATTLTKLSLMSGRSVKSEELMKEAIEIQEELVAEYSDVVVYRIAAAQSYFQQAEMYQFRKQPEKARVSIDNAIGHIERLSEQTKLVGVFQTSIDRLKERRSNIEKRLNADK